MGKTEKGAVWLDPEKLRPTSFSQYWRNIDDADVGKCLRMLTFLPVDEIEAMEKAGDINRNKERLAHELTVLVHGREEADKALEAAVLCLEAGETVKTCLQPFCRRRHSQTARYRSSTCWC